MEESRRVWAQEAAPHSTGLRRGHHCVPGGQGEARDAGTLAADSHGREMVGVGVRRESHPLRGSQGDKNER